MVTVTFGVAIVLRMVLGFFVKGDFQVLGDVLPFCRRWMLESGSQLDSKLETEGLKKIIIFCPVSVQCTCQYSGGLPIPDFGHSVCVHRVVDVVAVLVRWHHTWTYEKGHKKVVVSMKLVSELFCIFNSHTLETMMSRIWEGSWAKTTKNKILDEWATEKQIKLHKLY